MPLCLLAYSAISVTEILLWPATPNKKAVNLGHSSSNGEIIKPKLFHGKGHDVSR